MTKKKKKKILIESDVSRFFLPIFIELLIGWQEWNFSKIISDREKCDSMLPLKKFYTIFSVINEMSLETSEESSEMHKLSFYIFNN